MSVFVDIWDIIGVVLFVIGAIGLIIVYCIISLCDVFERIGKRFHKKGKDEDDES